MPSSRPVIAIDCRAATAKTSGVGRYIVNLLTGLSELTDARFALLVGDSVHPQLTTLSNSDLVPLGDQGNQRGYVQRLRWEQAQLAGLLRKVGADVYHATWNYGVPWNCPCPAVVTVHDLLPLRYRQQFGSRKFLLAFSAGQYIALTRARRIITGSFASLSDIRRFAPWVLRKAEVIPYGVESRFTKGTTGEQPSCFLYVGGFEARKNVRLLLRGYEIAVSEHGITLPLLLTGFENSLLADDRAVLEALSSDVRARIQFVGFVADDDLPGLYRRAAALLFPSYGEGFGFPTLEANACGTPVITTRCGGLPEAVGNNACFVDPERPGSLADAIVRVTTDQPYRTRLIEGGLEHAAQMTWRRASTQTLQVYERLWSRT